MAQTQEQNEFFEAQKTLMSNNRELKKSLIRLAQVGREKRINELTLEELGTLPGDVKTYQSVGKMFLLTPKGDITADLQTKIQKADREVQSLKRQTTFLEKKIKESEDVIKATMMHQQQQR